MTLSQVVIQHKPAHYAAKAASPGAEETAEGGRGELPAVKQLKEWFSPGWCCPDTEKLAEQCHRIAQQRSMYRFPVHTGL